MIDLFDIVLSYFHDKGWPVDLHPEQPVVRMAYECKAGSWFCYGRVNEDANQFIFVSVAPEKAPQEKRLAVAEYLVRANFGLNIGNFEMDFKDGEIRYKTSIDVTHDRLTIGLVDPLVMASLVSMEDHWPAIQSVIAGKATPVEAIERVHKKIEDDNKENEDFDLIL